MEGSTRKTYSCAPCRMRKVKCDKTTNPCKNCLRRGVTCTWSSSAVLPSSRSSAAITTSAPSSIAGSTSSSPQPSQVPPIRHVSILPLRPPSAAATAGVASTSPATSATSPQSALQGQDSSQSHEAFDHSILGGPTPPTNATSPVEAPQLPQRSLVSEGKRKGTAKVASFPFASSWDDQVEALVKLVPEKPIADALVTLYLERVDWIHKPLHVPSFLHDYDRWWSLSPQQRLSTHHSSPTFLALLFVVLVLGMHFSDQPIILSSSSGGSSASSQAQDEDLLFRACQQALSASNFMAHHSVEFIQIIICLCLWLNNTDKSETAKIMLAIAVKMALSIGLHRIPQESSCTSEGLLQREVGRRLWWSLVCQDSYTASNCNCSLMIHMSQMSTELFGNSDDDDLVEDGRGVGFVNKPREEVTASSFHLAKIPFALTTRSYIEALNSSFPDPPYSKILQLDTEYSQIYASLPPFLRPDIPQPLSSTLFSSSSFFRKQLNWERIFTGITFHNRLIRLHRSYFLRAFEEPEFRTSYERCLESSWALLELAKESRLVGFPGTRWWVVLVHIWTAGLVISSDLLRDNRPVGHPDTNRKREGVELALSLLSPTRLTSPVSERACAFLRGFLDQDLIRRTYIHSFSEPVLPALPAPAPQLPPQPYEPQQPLEDQFDPSSFDALFAWDFSDPQTEPDEQFWSSLFGSIGSGVNGEAMMEV